MTKLAVNLFQGSIPHGMEFPTTLLFVHLLAPMLGPGGEDDPTPFLSDMYTLALYQASAGIKVPGAQGWIQAGYAALLWRLAPDRVSALLGQFRCIQIGSDIVLDFGVSMLSTDPILATGMVLSGLGLVLALFK